MDKVGIDFITNAFKGFIYRRSKTRRFAFNVLTFYMVFIFCAKEITGNHGSTMFGWYNLYADDDLGMKGIVTLMIEGYVPSLL